MLSLFANDRTPGPARHPVLTLLLPLLLTAAAGTALLALTPGLSLQSGMPALVWPFAGLALGSLVRWGWSMLLGLALAAAAASLLQGQNQVHALSSAIAALSGASISYAAWLTLGRSRSLRFRADVLALLLPGAVLGGGAHALSLVLAESLAQGSLLAQLDRQFLTQALQCWAAAAAGTLLLAPCWLADWRAHRLAAGGAWQPGNLLLMLTALGLSLAGARLPLAGAPLLLLPPLLLGWLALRCPLGPAALTALGMAIAPLLLARQGLAPVFAGEQGQLLLWIWCSAMPLVVLLTHGTQGELQLQSENWRRSMAATGAAFAEWHTEPGRNYRSPGWMLLMGHSMGSTAHADDWLDRLHPNDHQRVLQALEQLQQGSEEWQDQIRLRSEDAQWLPFELRLQVRSRDLHGRVGHWLSCLTDTSLQRQAREQQRLANSLFQHLHEGLLITDAQHQVLDANPSYCELMGMEREALIGKPAAPLDIYVLRLSGHDPQDVRELLEERGHWQGLVTLLGAQHTQRRVQLTVSVVPEAEGSARYHVLAVSDRSIELQQRELIERQTRYDLKTGLLNRSEFMLRLKSACRQSEREGFMLCLCHLDLDQFKRINQGLGEAEADRVLVEVAERLRSSLRNASQWSDEVARLGGDGFALLLRCHSLEEARQAVERFLTVLRAPFYLDDQQAPLNLTGSIGATLFPQDASGAETLMRHAAHALYRVKRSGRDTYEFFDTEKRLRNEQRVLAMGRMQQALDSGELLLYYQPKVDMRSGKVLGMEALLRWHHPERGVLGPGTFLPLIEQTGLGVQVGDWVFEQAMRQCSQWLALGLDLNISVNVAARHLQAEDFALRLKELLARHEAAVASHLMLEVLESAALADIDATHALIQRCKGLGVSFALDDFGTGYSTLTYLKRLPVDTLKIDRSFVQNMLIDNQDHALVEGVLGLARTFGCEVVAEGVESAAHAEALLALGCHIGQGNGIAMAMPAAQVSDWVKAFEAAPSFGGRVELPRTGTLD
ncbi:EAL domain-containing protein [Paucibacter sp. APW11]|uniref:EAL domain-containing protein n=1 Tax=Roseateles aquae TaxID=3077235 RepID=A0ABU3P7D2_9BURK|nr:EAL domain-containing protein [Paucibacter sp. APW11]MDT8998465.1 EAL domain-containing protein [Paucibacter sp. APW11]